MAGPLDFDTLENRNKLRGQIFESAVLSFPTSPNPVAGQQFADFATGLPTQAFSPNAGAFAQGVGQVQQDQTRRESDLRRKVSAYEMADRPTPEQEAEVAGLKKSSGWLNTILDVIDAPRRWSFENFVVPAAKSIGGTFDATVPDKKIDPTGYDVWIKALGGASAQSDLKQHLQRVGFDENWSEGLSQKGSGLAGLGLDIIFDPLSYLTFGAGAGVKGGGRVLAKAGEELAEGLLKGPSYKMANQVLGLLPARHNVPRETVQELAAAAAGVATRDLKVPEVDAVLQALRGSTAAPDLFKRGGAHVILPMNIAELHVPLLNREEQWGLFLEGMDASALVSPLNMLHRTAVDLGQGALARLPVVGGLQDAAGAVGQGVRNVFVPYAQLQGVGRPFLVETLKSMQNVGKAERETAYKQVERLFKDLGEAQKERAQYWLDIGAVRMTPQGTVEKLDFEDFALEQLAKEPGFGSLDPGDAGAMLGERVYDVEQRLGEQSRELAQDLAILQNVGSGQQVKPRALAALRPNSPATATAGVDVVQKMLERVDEQIATRQLDARHDTFALVKELENAVNQRRAGVALPPTTLEALEPDEGVRKLLRGLLAEETQLTPAGPVRALLDLSLRFGQQSHLQNYLTHIRVSQAPGVASSSAGGRQLGIRRPGEIGKQRTSTYLAEPEELEALGYLTDPQAILGTKLAQYRTMAREQNFVKWVLEHYGRKLTKTGVLREGENNFNPRDWFTKGMPAVDDLREQLKFFREKGDLLPEEYDALVNLQVPRGAGSFQQWALPDDVIKGLQETRKAASQAGGFFAAVDGAMAVLRAGATLPAPSYHFRNVLGNLFNSTLGGVPPYRLKELDWSMRFLKGEVAPEVEALLRKANPLGGAAQLDPLGQIPAAGRDPQELADWFRRTLTERGVLSAGNASVDTAARLAGKNPVERGIMAASDNFVFKGLRNTAEATDNFFRLRHLFSRMGMGDTLEAAILSTKKYLFDFHDLSDVERRFLRPGAFFYSWTRKNLPLMLETLLASPKAYTRTAAFYRAAQDRGAQDEAEASLMPAFIREQLGIVLGSDENGRVQVLSGVGLPLEDLNTFSSDSPERFIQKLVGFTNPVIQALAVAGGMPTPLTGQPLLEDAEGSFWKNVGPIAGPVMREINRVAPGLPEWMDVQEKQVTLADGREVTRYSGNPLFIYALSQFTGMGRLKQMGDRFVKTLQEDNTPEGWRKEATRELTGTKEYDIDFARQLEALETSGRSRSVDAEHDQALSTLADQLVAGEILPEAWRERRREAKSRRGSKRDELLEQQLIEDKVPIGEASRSAIQAHRNTFVPEGRRLLEFVMDMDPTDDNPLTGKPFASASEFAKVRAEFMDKLEKEQPDAAEQLDKAREKALSRLSPKARDMEERYALAIAALDVYSEVPKYVGLSADEEAQVDAVRDMQSAVSRSRGPAFAKQYVRQQDPEGFALSQRAKANTRARKAKWQELNQQTKGMLGAFFGNLPLAEAEELAGYSGLATPAFAD